MKNGILCDISEVEGCHMIDEIEERIICSRNKKEKDLYLFLRYVCSMYTKKDLSNEDTIKRKGIEIIKSVVNKTGRYKGTN